jgi:hypothetical protein
MAGDDAGSSDATDRAAILARRQRFIALALSGLAAACGDDNGNGTSPMPCLDVAPQTESATMTGATQTGTDGMSSTSVGTSGGSTGTPMPCLDVQPPTSSGPSDDSTSSTGTDTDDGTTDGGSDSTGKPMPCLAPKGP